MAVIAEVTGRPDGQVFMGNMAAALQTGGFATSSDDLVLTEPGWTLFSIDFAADDAIFLDIGAKTDLASAPFSYQRQFDTARRILRMRLSDFLDLGERCPVGEPLVHLFNMGHCGSTLLHHVFNRSGQAWCLSEPLVTFDLAMNRDALSADRLTALMRAGLRMLRFFPGIAGRRLVVKHFSQVNTIIPECHQAEPDATCLFLYRSGEAWCNSLYGFYQRLAGGGLELLPEDRAFSWLMMSADTPLSALDDVVDMAAPVVTFDSLAAVAWSLQLQSHARARAANVPLHSFRYEELIADRAASLAQVFNWCGLQPDGIAAGLAAFDEDSHKGAVTSHARAVEQLDEVSRSRIRQIFAHPKIKVTGRERLA
ncbi:hypothetical protein [Tabrizicola sp.]|uniref:hypothetical protein n=1 Tax=Tabrizicola sp. TaxID=2005166 RepID=UPI00286BEC86|nr:hypothetical protein [Tabrizicola sp.]